MFITKILKSENKSLNSSSFSAAAIGHFPKEFQLTFSDRFDKGFILIFTILFLIFMPITGWLSTIGPPEVSLEDYEDLLAQYTETIIDVNPTDILDEVEEEISSLDDGTAEEKVEEVTEAEQEVSANEESGPTAEQVQERRKQRLATQRAAAAAAASSAAAEAAAGVGVFKELVGKGGGYGGAASSGGLTAGATGAGGGLDAVLSQVGGVKSGTGSSALGGGGGTLGGAGGLGALGGVAEGGIGGGTAAGSLKGSGKIGNLQPPRVKGEAAKNAYRNPNAIASVMNSYQGAVQFCYETEKRVNPKLKGKISIVFDIIESGRVKGASIKSSSMRNRKVETCILRNIQKWKFEEIDPGTGEVSVERTYIFQ